MDTNLNNYYRVLANCTETQASHLASLVLKSMPDAEVKLLSGPRLGLVMLRVEETVVNSQFNAGEILVTEVRLELDGQFGFGMVIGNSPQRSMAMALVDAAFRQPGLITEELRAELNTIEGQIREERYRLHNLVASTRVEFETM